MVQAHQRTNVRGPTFIRLLARLTDVDVSPSRQSLSDRLGQWLDWTHAVALSTTLDGKPSEAAFDMSTFGSVEENECVRVRTSLVSTITGDRTFATSRERGAEHASAEEGGANEAVDYSAFRQRYLAIQRSMQAATGSLRGRLRDMLAQTTADMARLAAVDAVMERALSPREQTLLGHVPALLGEHFERLRQTEQKALADAQVSEDAPAIAPGAWLDVFRKDVQSVLLAELDVRFHPVEGLLAALRTNSLERHVQKSA
ncbi:DUF3348 domain-containing protein [Rhodanobacter sp. C01]|uniref:DUF3348 domain-containing protein n=1 Tax=Rhodanobacter sp. C01 TaxID=1945856 RepID=UPI0009876C5D|nr:DUF3348 domain-containing protein [Rhodanobacter sp. C01]OOG47067.1 hypothetical protein B0E50_14140 [Rhodanobacter sp. C01]